MRRWSHHSWDGVLAATVLLLLLPGAGGLATHTLAQEPGPANSLRFGAQARGIMMGAEVAPQPLENETRYAETLAREFNLVVPGKTNIDTTQI